MWQVLVAAAAAAGSGILAKKFITPNGAEIETSISDCNQKYLESGDSVSKSDDAFEENGTREKREIHSDDAGVFRFSCPGTESKELRKNARDGFGFLKKNGGSKMGKKKKGVAANVAADHQVGSGSGRRVSICLKKRRTGKHTAGKCESCVSKDNSFGWGVGVGIMYMMQAGTAEISKLNSAMDETVKTVQELKDEISRRRNAQNVNASVAANEAKANEMLVERSCHNPEFTRIGAKNKDNLTAFSGDYASSILSDNQQPEVLEMHQLEAELESELQKLPWCAMEASSSEGRADVFEGVLAEGQPLEEFENSDSYQYNGVLPGELNQKLCHLLVEQQENQIMDLETELHQAHSKLHQKEAELQALKDCVKRLTEFSLVNASDEEGEDDAKVLIGDGVEEKVGTKRSIGYESYICSEK